MGKPGPETKLVKKMRDEARRVYGDRIVTIKYHGSGFSEAGVSDLLICLDGYFIAVEVKAPESYGGSVERALEQGPSTKQLAFLDRVSRSGGAPFVAATVEGFMSLLAEVSEP